MLDYWWFELRMGVSIGAINGGCRSLIFFQFFVFFVGIFGSYVDG